MKLSLASRNAIHAVVELVNQGQVKASNLTAATPQAKSLHRSLLLLATAGVLHSRRGYRGGYRLARPAKDITVLEIVEAVDGPLIGRSTLPQQGGPSPLDRELERLCAEAARRTREVLSKVTVADLVKRSARAKGKAT